MRRFGALLFGIFSGCAAGEPGQVMSLDSGGSSQGSMDAGGGLAPECKGVSVDPASVEFRADDEGRYPRAVVRVTTDCNTRIESVRLREDTGAFTFSISGGRLPLQLLDGEFLPVFVEFTGGGMCPSDADTLIIEQNPGPPVELPLRVGFAPNARFEPERSLTLDASRGMSVADIKIRNTGCEDLEIRSVRIAATSSASTASADDFLVLGCQPLPCEPGWVLRPEGTGSSTASEREVRVLYSNNDNSTTDDVELIFETNDPVEPTHSIRVNAVDIPCFLPTPIIRVVTNPSPNVGETMRLSADDSEPGGRMGRDPRITEYRWHWISTPGSQPEFTPSNSEDTRFVPLQDGRHVLGLDLVNNCDGVSVQPAMLTIDVRP